jgi:hypothetical protein
MSDRGDRHDWVRVMPGHPVREELEFSAWMDAHPLPWPAPKVNHRLCISTVPFDDRWPTTTTDETTYSVSIEWPDE